MTSLIQDLTSIVKEQKAKIAELMKSNEEATANIKVQTLWYPYSKIQSHSCI